MISGERFVVICWTGGVDIVTVQKLVGHSSPVTTAKYDRRGEETKRKAVQCLSI